MRKKDRADRPDKGQQPFANKVKSGCRTCKIRKVKCDESRPACCRCTSTGRTCDGYGIWDGGGEANLLNKRIMPVRNDKMANRSVSSSCTSILAAQRDDIRLFEWLEYRTVRKIPGLFGLPFWDRLLLPACLSEPAVLHAALALSSVHMKHVANVSSESKDYFFPNEQDQLMLQHYVMASKKLQPCASTNDRAFVRTALIACVLFVCLEHLQGHVATAQRHLYNGIAILKEANMIYDDGVSGVLLWSPSHEPAEDWIVGIFSRLTNQAELFYQYHQHPYKIIRAARNKMPIPLPTLFGSSNDAWQRLELLMSRALTLSQDYARLQNQINQHIEHIQSLLAAQKLLKVELNDWFGVYERSKKHAQKRSLEAFAYQLLHIYYIMVYIMAGTSLMWGDESFYDHYTPQFLSLITMLATFWTLSFSDAHLRLLRGHLSNESPSSSGSIIDFGWIPPLHYIALKCRVHRIRLHAIRLLETTFHKEGIWNSRVSARVARKIMEIEEEEFYNDAVTADQFLLSEPPAPEELLLPILPAEHRIGESQVILSDDFTDHVVLLCRRKRHQEQGNFNWDEEVHICDVR